MHTDPREGGVIVVRFMFGIAKEGYECWVQCAQREKGGLEQGRKCGECDQWGPAEVHHTEALVTLERVPSLRI